MSEADFFPASGGQFRGSKYPGFTGGTTDSSGNIQPVGSASANISQSSGNNLTPAQVQQQQVTMGNAAAQTNGSVTATPPVGAASSALNQQSIPSTTLGGLAAQTALPFAGDVVGTAAGKAIGEGASFGDALSQGGEALSSKGADLLSGNFGGLLGTSSGAAGTGAAAGVGAATTGGTSAGIADGLPAVNVGTPAVDSLGENAVSSGTGASAADAAGNIGGSALSGVGTFAADLISGEGVGQAAISGVGSAAGAYLGSLVAPGVGTVVGGFLGGLVGGLFGGGAPSVGPDGVTGLLVNNGMLNVGSTGADNGADRNVTLNAATSTATAINKILADNNLTLSSDPNYNTVGGGGYSGLGIYQGSPQALAGAISHGGVQRSALDVWNYLLANNMIQSKTPSAPPSTAGSTVGTASGANGSVLVPGSITQ